MGDVARVVLVAWMCTSLSVGCAEQAPPPPVEPQTIEAEPEAKPEPPPKPVATCQDTCLAQGQASYEECLQNGTASEVCRENSSALEQACLDEKCSEDTTEDCPSTCEAVAKTDTETCVAEGSPQDLCATLANAKLAACRATCGESP